MPDLYAEPLERQAFAPFGDVIETEGAENYLINSDLCRRFNDLAGIEVTANGGRPLINIFQTKMWPLPLQVKMLERHPLSSQAFIPLDYEAMIVVVAAPGDAPVPGAVRAFVSHGRQGVNYRPGVWHHPLVAMAEGARFLVVDRGGAGENCDEHPFGQAQWLTVRVPS